MILWLAEGDAPTRCFHAHTNVRRWQNHIHSLRHQCQTVVDEDDMAAVMFNFFNEALGSVTPRSNTINLNLLGL
jgi:hypothetical protein